MIEPSQSLQAIFENCIKVAKEHEHEYITIEHIAYGIMCDNDAYTLIESFGADANFIKTQEIYKKSREESTKKSFKLLTKKIKPDNLLLKLTSIIPFHKQ